MVLAAFVQTRSPHPVGLGAGDIVLPPLIDIFAVAVGAKVAFDLLAFCLEFRGFEFCRE